MPPLLYYYQQNIGNKVKIWCFMDRFDAMQAFVAVATEGNFSKAAERLNTSNQLISKYVGQLEEHLGVRLFNRTTRKVSLTEAGEQCFHLANNVLENMSALEGHFGELQTEAKGLLKINAPVSFSTLHLSPLIRDFKKQYPNVGIDLHLNDRVVDVVEEGFDLALRIGHLKSSSLIAKKIAPVRLVLCASPQYLQKNGNPTHPNELNAEEFLRYSYLDYNQLDPPLADALKQKNSKFDRGLVSNNGEVLTEAAIAGEGFILQPTFIVSDAIKKGQLEIILQDFEPDPVALYVVYPHRKFLAAKLRVFIDFISGYYGNPPYWDTSIT